ncbi:MAG: DNA polymerase I [Myxococcota bacterium]|nr:DNA polymerase I [Myxococcota bacterium]
MSEKVFLVDGSNHAFRVFFAMPKMTAGGLNTGALLGFANMLRKFEKEYAPDYVVVVFDKGKSFRVDLYPEYKGHRPQMPDELSEQWPKFPEMVEAWGYPCLAIPGFEADDVLGTLARRWASPDRHVWLVTGDKDFYQLVDENISILDVMKDREIREPEVVERFGVGPQQVIDVLGLAGDSSDNVPGVSGVGEKTASKYVQKYGDLENVIAHAAEIGGKRGAALAEEAEMARLSKTLVTICTDVELDLELDHMRERGPDVEALREIFLRYQFRSHLNALDGEGDASGSVVKTGKYRAVTTRAELEEVVAQIVSHGRVAVDLETTSLDPQQAGLVGVSLCWQEDSAVYVPVGHCVDGVLVEGQLTEAEAMELLCPLLANDAVEKVGHNLKYDLSVLRCLGYPLTGIAGDTMIADYLLEPERRSHKLDDLAMRYLGHKMVSYAEATEGLGADTTFADVDLEKATNYAAEDAHATWLLDGLLLPKLEEAGLDSVYSELEVPLIEVISGMELAGIGLNVEQLGVLSAELAERMESLESEIYELAGHEFTINSPKQLQEVLFVELGLKGIKKTKTGFSTDAETLERLSGVHPLPKAVLEYRGLHKLKSTYVDALPKSVSGIDARVHTSYHQVATATGRLASNNPNLQNIPSRTEDGRRVRACFVADPGHVFLSCDYSQIELRILAHYCGEGGLLEAFRLGQDVHSRTASEIFGVPIEEVTQTQRSSAKAINFGIVYGMSAFRLGNELGIPTHEAQSYLDDYFARYPQVPHVHETLIEHAREHGHAITLWGRKRPIVGINSSNGRDRMSAERIAINTPLQGSAADLIKVAMRRVSNRLDRDSIPAKVLLQVHDELLLEVPEDRVEEVAGIVKEEMAASASLAVPLVVDAGWGATWEQAH